MTFPEKRDVTVQLLKSRFNTPLCCAKILEDETLNAWRCRKPNLTLSSIANEVQYEIENIENTSIEG